MKRMIYNFFLLAGILVAGTAYAQVQRDTVANYPLDRKVDITMTTSLIRTVSGEKLDDFLWQWLKNIKDQGFYEVMEHFVALQKGDAADW